MTLLWVNWEGRSFIEDWCQELPIAIFGCSNRSTGTGRFRLRSRADRTSSSIVVFSRATWLQPVKYFWAYLRISAKEYDLYIRFDTNTNGHMQWFYFSVKNNKKCKVRFNIFRFRKCYSLFQRGLRPYVRSRRTAGDWAPGGDKVKYYR